MRYSVSLVCLLFCAVSVHATDAETVIQKITAQRALVKDWSALYSHHTTGFGQETVEMGRITVKGDHIRKDIQRPIRRTRVQTSMLVTEKDEVTGELTTTDLSQKSGMMGLPKMTPEEALQQVSFQVVSENETEIVLAGALESIRMQMTVDATRFVPVKMTLTLPGGAEMVMTQTYEEVSEIPVLTGSETTMSMMMGSRRETMGVRLLYRNVKVNQGVNDDVFRL
jgi:outer membrane lipoprotein-sorting protein